jgi:four helix bundle suffix protein
MTQPGFIPKFGGYEKLLSYQKARVVYKGIEHDDPAICANVLGGLTRVTIRLLNGQLDRLERDFVTEGGLRERMTRARLEFRDRAAAHERQRAALRPSLKVPSVPLVPSKRPTPTPMTQSPHN